jgi:hypothetical protein
METGRGQPLDLVFTVQPALEVEFYMLDGDIIYFGTTGAVQMEIRDLDGNPFDPDGSIYVEVYRVVNNAPETAPAVKGVATQVKLEGVPMAGRYLFEFDADILNDAAPPSQGLARAKIPYQDASVVWQKTFQLKSLSDLS